MKKGIIIITFIFLLISSLSAQSPYWQWANQAGGSGIDEGAGIYTDGNGNVYTTGTFQETATFGTTQITTYGLDDVFVCKTDSDGNWLWAKHAGGTSTDYGMGIIVDASGNSYIAGYFTGIADFGSTQLTSDGGEDIFVAKLDSDGNWLWAKRAGGPDDDTATYSLGLDDNNNVYITGSFVGVANFGSTQLTGTGICDIFVAKLDSDGNWLWAQRAGGNSRGFGMAISSDDNGNSYITGLFMDTLHVGSTTLTTFPSGPDIYLAKIDANGNWLWAKQAGDNSFFPDAGSSVGIDAAGNVYITGYFMVSATFGSITISNINPGIPNCDIFVAKADSDGNWLWATPAGASDPSGNDDKGKAICVEPNGNSSINGFFMGTVSFGSSTVTSNGESDIYVAKIDADGNWLWATSAGGIDSEICQGVWNDANGNPISTGWFKSSISFGDISFMSCGDKDIFISKVSATPIIGDFNGDGYVDATDLQMFGDHWHFVDTDPGWDAMYDLYPDGIIDASDLQIFGDHWHEGTPPESAKGGGPNAEAGIMFDLDATTYGNQNLTHIGPQAAGTMIRVDVYATGVHNLDTYEFNVVYDPNVLEYKGCAATNPLTFEENILTSEGGTAIGWMVDNSTPGILNIAYTLAGEDTTQAPEGEGLIADIVFQAKVTTYGMLSFSNVYYYDTFKVKDAITNTGTATLPVELSAFTATYNTENGYTSLSWTTASETDIQGYNVYRSTEDAFDTSKQLNAAMIDGHGTTTEMNTYEFVDLDQLNFGTTYYYWLESVEYGGISTVYTSIKLTPEEGNGGFVDDFSSNSLSNYPNPFRSTTTISYSIKGMLKSEPIQISIYNMLGQLVDTVEGRYGTATWNTKDHSTGIYFYKLNTDSYTEIKKMMVTK